MAAARVYGHRGILALAQSLRAKAPAEVALFFDSACPICRREIQYYKWLDSDRRRIDWVDLHDPGNDLRARGIELDAALGADMSSIHPSSCVPSL